jgi:hypothetical protein
LYGILIALIAVALCLAVFEKLRAWGTVLVAEARQQQLERDSDEPVPAPAESAVIQQR